MPSSPTTSSSLQSDDVAAIDELRDVYRKLKAELSKVIVGQDQVIEQLVISRGLLLRRERVQRGELRPCRRQHLARRVELQRARSQRDHRMRQRKIAPLQPRTEQADIACAKHQMI